MDFSHLEPALIERLERLGVKPEDVTEHFILGSGAGGQKINKTANCVQLVHAPSGIEIRCQQTRLRSRNRILAVEELCERLEEFRRREQLEKKRRRAIQRWKKRKPSPSETRRRLESKRRRSKLKAQRGKLRGDD